MDEATARATAIHDGAERRLNLLMSRHTEAIRRLTEIRDVVTSLVAGETDRGSLEDEVARAVAGTVAGSDSQAGRRSPAGQPVGQQGNGRPAAPAEGRHASGPVQTDAPVAVPGPQPGGNGGTRTAHLPSSHQPGPQLPGSRQPSGADTRPVPSPAGRKPEGDDTLT
jgi:hypothetical protein